MNSAYFEIEIWHRKRMIYKTEKENIDSFIKFYNALSYEININEGTGEIILKHKYVSSKESRAIARIAFDSSCEVGHSGQMMEGKQLAVRLLSRV